MNEKNRGADFNWDILIYATIIIIFVVLSITVMRANEVVSELADTKSHSDVVTTDKDNLDKENSDKENSDEPISEITTIVTNS